MKICYRCKIPIEMDEITFRSECPSCSADLHVCFNCSFYDTTKHNSCSEGQADFVREKDRANYCEYFKFIEHREEDKKSKREEAEKLWSTIFKKQ
ncbi:MAG TPA: hypothetical protein PLM71_06460 [Syntrophorhabdaceae bacterium]|nr:hypothetical protein [Syntrophorhabdaceae bacterium]HPU29949.1 hypothetical protein [Syntrophorhabdaceae bacterium]